MPAVQYILTIDSLTSAPIESYSFGAQNSASIGSQSTGAGAGKVTFNPFSITRKIDKASPTLFKACVTGQHFARLTLLLPAVQDGLPGMTIALGTVQVTDINEAGNVHGLPLEQLEFSFRTFEILVDEHNFAYDVERGRTI